MVDEPGQQVLMAAKHRPGLMVRRDVTKCLLDQTLTGRSGLSATRRYWFQEDFKAHIRLRVQYV